MPDWTDCQRWLTLDFEAARDKHGKLFPIEIGVANLKGQVWASLIRPPPHWEAGATAHQPKLLAEAMNSGRSPSEVVAALRKITQGYTLILSDALFVDQPLVERLYAEAASETHALPCR